jgi:hypothetical protein
VLRVAQESVKDRQLVSDQVAALAGNKLRPDMDVSLAKGFGSSEAIADANSK